MEISADDLRLVAWLDAEVPPDKGKVGLPAVLFRGGPDDRERHIQTFSGALAPVLYGRYCNFRFGIPEFGRGWEDYSAHVKEELDVAWCLREGIRYFYLAPHNLYENPGLARALKEGRLRPVHASGESCVYAVEAGPRPVIVRRRPLAGAPLPQGPAAGTHPGASGEGP
jgi:hypothetical protein